VSIKSRREISDVTAVAILLLPAPVSPQTPHSTSGAQGSGVACGRNSTDVRLLMSGRAHILSVRNGPSSLTKLAA
jgi:hypothetical protein